MPRPRVNFPYWDLAREMESAEGISLPEAVQRVVEAAVKDALDAALGNSSGNFRLIRRDPKKTSIATPPSELRRQYAAHHPRREKSLSQNSRPQISRPPHVPKPVPEQRLVESSVFTPRVADKIIEEQKALMEKMWPKR